MDKPISVGDLVIVVRGSPCVCNSHTVTLGKIFRVGAIRMSRGRWCMGCDRKKPDVLIAEPDADSKGLIYSLDRLKRIPPLGDLESEKNDSKLTEPA